MNRFLLRGIIPVALLFVPLLLALPAGAQANAIDAAKAAGQIGERYDGYLGVVDPGASEDIRALADETNTGRRAKYEEIGRRNEVSAAQVARIAGAKLLDNAPAGQYIMPREGEWVVK